VAVLLISGTASIGSQRETLFPGDFRAQTRRTFDNITALLESRARTGRMLCAPPATCAISSRDYAAFNEERTAFYGEQELEPLPASTGIQAILCRPDLLVEIEAIAMFRIDDARRSSHVTADLARSDGRGGGRGVAGQTPASVAAAQTRRPAKNREVRLTPTRLKTCGPMAISPRLTTSGTRSRWSTTARRGMCRR